MDLLTARDIQNLLDVDKSTVYRMAGDGRLPAVKVGRQWRFPAASIEAMFDLGAASGDVASRDVSPRPSSSEHVPTPVVVGPIDTSIAAEVISLIAESLGVMMVVTDVSGVPVTPIINAVPRLAGRLHDPAVFADCLDEWREMAADLDLAPRFHGGSLGFECARTFLRSGTELVGMVLAGGVAPEGSDGPDLYRLDPDQRRLVIALLPKVGAFLSRVAVVSHRRPE